MINKNTVYYMDYCPPHLEEGDSMILKFRSFKALKDFIKTNNIQEKDIISISNTPIKKLQEVSQMNVTSLFNYIAEINYR